MALAGVALLLVAAAFYVHAGHALARDARGGYDASMGGAGLFSGSWLLGAASASAGVVVLLGLHWGWSLPLFALFYAPRTRVYRAIVARHLGREAPPLPRDGFKEYLRRTGQDRKPD